MRRYAIVASVLAAAAVSLYGFTNWQQVVVRTTFAAEPGQPNKRTVSDPSTEPPPLQPSQVAPPDASRDLERERALERETRALFRRGPKHLQPDFPAAELNGTAAAALEDKAQAGQALDRERTRNTSLEIDLAAARREVEAHTARAAKAAGEAAQFKKAADAAAQLKLASEATAAGLKNSLQQEHDRAETLETALANTRREAEASASRARDNDVELARLKQLSFTASLWRERDRAEGLAIELKKARRELETRTAPPNPADDERFKADAAAIADLKRSLQQERARADTLAGEVAEARRNSNKDADCVVVSKPYDTSACISQAVGNTAREPALPTVAAPAATPPGSNAVPPSSSQTAGGRPASAPSKDSPEVIRLLARARLLLDQGNVVAARALLERAAEIGDAQASFKLAETYDTAILLAWQTQGTRGDTAKARDLYAKALAGGIQEARSRIEALSQQDEDVLAARNPN
ncbi:MAG: hypothetical protein JWR80_5666 [Bradyrhizobium sp.]|nr:hypothetical protein [Bradyrhizobium sp.]